MNVERSLSLFSLSCLTVLGMQAQEKEHRPNIILFMVDDMGWQDTSLPFWREKTTANKQFETPNMERLASQGMKFTQAYAASLSSPSRCSLITGANAARHRVTNWTLKKNQTTDNTDSIMSPPVWNTNGICQIPGVPRTYVGTTFVELLKRNGYHTIHCGKAHFGAIDTPGENPYHLGFEVNIAGHAAGGPASYLGEENYGHTADGKPVSLFAIPGLKEYWHTPTFATEALTLEALKALDKAKRLDQPFFLYMAHYAIHVPINRDQRFYDKYIQRGLSPKEAAYAALIEGMDKSLGDIMHWLEQNNEVDNTVLIFMSDNGGLANSAYWRDAPLHWMNYPLRSGKGALLEGGIREPMIVRWPGKVKAGTTCNSYLLIEDFYPTILEMAGVRHYHTPQTIDGVSFMPLLTGSGDPSKGRSLIWNFPNCWDGSGPGINFNTAIRKGDWKLIYNYKTGKKELYNIPNDISEEHDLSAEHPQLVKALSKELGRRLRSMKAQRPIFNKTGKLALWPDEQ